MLSLAVAMTRTIKGCRKYVFAMDRHSPLAVLLIRADLVFVPQASIVNNKNNTPTSLINRIPYMLQDP